MKRIVMSKKMNISLKKVKFDDYQRSPNQKHIKNIVENFNPSSIQRPILSYRDNKYFCIDGQHRILALIRMGILYWDCDVLEGLSKEEEAEMWNDFNGNSKVATSLEKAYARLKAGDDYEIYINNLVNECGTNIEYKSGRKGITAYTSLVRLEKKFGKEKLQEVILIIKNSLGEKNNSFAGDIMEGMMYFIEENRGNKNFKIDEFEKKLKDSGLSLLKQKKMLMKNAYQINGKYAVIRALKEIYNYNKSKVNRI